MKICVLLILCEFLFNILSADNVKSVISDDQNDEIEMNNLLKFALTSKDNRALANEEYLRKYGQMPLEITHILPQFFFWNNRILIDYDIAENFLRAFGRSIKSLTIASVSIPMKRHRQIGKYVNEYCFETLVEFNSNMCTKDIFNDMRKPFQRVESVELGGEFWEKLVDELLALNALFPEMYRFTLDSETKGYILDLHYPKLTELNIISPNIDYVKLIEKNQQIQKIKLTDCSTEFLDTVENKLPNVVTLIFNVPKDLPQYQGSKIQFEGIKELVITDLYQSFSSDKIDFNHLDRFELLTGEYIHDEWIKFFENTDGQQSLVLSIGNISDSTIPKLPTNLKGSIELRIGCSFDEIEGTAQFLEKNKQTKHITLNCPRSSPMFHEQLSNILDKEWKINPVNENHCSFDLASLTTLPDNSEVTNPGQQQSQSSDSESNNNQESEPDNTSQESAAFEMTANIFVFALLIFITIEHFL